MQSCIDRKTRKCGKQRNMKRTQTRFFGALELQILLRHAPPVLAQSSTNLLGDPGVVLARALVVLVLAVVTSFPIVGESMRDIRAKNVLCCLSSHSQGKRLEGGNA